MLATGTPKPNRKVCFALFTEGRDQEFDQILHLIEELIKSRILCDIA